MIDSLKKAFVSSTVLAHLLKMKMSVYCCSPWVMCIVMGSMCRHCTKHFISLLLLKIIFINLTIKRQLCRSSFTKTRGESRNLLVTSYFSFSHSVIYPLENFPPFSSNSKFVSFISGFCAFDEFLYACRRRDILWDHPWRAGGVQFFVRSISPKLL